MRRTVTTIVIGALVGALWSSAAFAGVLNSTALASLAPASSFSDAFAMSTFNRVPEQSQNMQAVIPTALHGLRFRFAPSSFLANAPVQPAYMTTSQPLPSAALGYDQVFSLHDALNHYGYLSLQPGMGAAHASVALPSVNLSGAFAGFAGFGSFLAFGLANAGTLAGVAAAAPNLPPVADAQHYSGPILIGTTGPSTPLHPTVVPSAALVASVPAGSDNTATGATMLDDTPPAFDSRLQDATTAISAPIRLGAFSVSNVNVAGFGEAPPSDDVHAHSYQWTAGTSFDVREKARRMNVNLDTNFAHVNSESIASFSYAEPANTAAPLAGFAAPAITDLQAVNPAFMAANDPLDVTARGLGAGFALPLTHHVTLGLQYGEQRFTGSYGVSATPNLDTSKYTYLGNLTFALPRNTAITFSARQYRYQDNLVPSNTSYETRADVNFSVKL